MARAPSNIDKVKQFAHNLQHACQKTLELLLNVLHEYFAFPMLIIQAMYSYDRFQRVVSDSNFNIGIGVLPIYLLTTLRYFVQNRRQDYIEICMFFCFVGMVYLSYVKELGYIFDVIPIVIIVVK